MFFILALIAIGWGDSASSAGFTYAAAERAYANAPAPSKDTFVKEWMLVGTAFALPSKRHNDRYFPDGKFQTVGYPGYFQEIQNFSFTKDAFGNDIYSKTTQVVGFETGKVYETRGPDAGMLTASVYVVESPAKDSYCGERQECRLVTVTPGLMLLCATFITDPRKGCLTYNPEDPSKPAFYSGSVLRVIPSLHP